MIASDIECDDGRTVSSRRAALAGYYREASEGRVSNDPAFSCLKMK
jgi:hypothetical protein